MTATWYHKGDDAIHATVKRVMQKHFKRLYDEELTVDVMIARREEGVPLKVRGRQALACIRITNLKERAFGRSDVEITIDGESMPGWSDKRTQAVIHHELMHIELTFSDKDGKVVRDDLDRPKLKMRGHDYEFGWFGETARVFGDDSFEVSQANSLVNDCSFVRQMILPGMELEPEEVGAA